MRGVRSNFLVIGVVLLLCFMPIVSAGYTMISDYEECKHTEVDDLDYFTCSEGMAIKDEGIVIVSEVGRDYVILKTGGDGFDEIFSSKLKLGDAWIISEKEDHEVSETDEYFVRVTKIFSEKEMVEFSFKYLDNNMRGTSCITCIFDGECVDVGARSFDKYCSLGGFKYIKSIGKKCGNNFECESNSCVNSICVESGLWQKFMNWFSNIF